MCNCRKNPPVIIQPTQESIPVPTPVSAPEPASR